MNGYSMIIVSKVFSKLFAFVFDDEIDCIKFFGDISDIVFDEGFSAEFEKRFWGSVSKRSHARAFAGSKYYEIHEDKKRT